MLNRYEIGFAKAGTYRKIIQSIGVSIVVLVTSLLGIGLFDLALAAQVHSFEDEYRKLQKLEFPTLKGPSRDVHLREERAIRDYFVQSGDAGARFLIAKLRAMNEDERKFLHGSEEFDIHVTQYTMLMMKRGQSTLLKYAVGFILADMFSHTNADTQTAILKEIVSSYTPSTYGKEDRQFLDFDLGRIGRPGVPYLIQVATHDFPTVRCGAMSALTDIAMDAKNVGLPDAPFLDCDASPEQRQISLRDWKAWWEKYGEKVPLAGVPSFFDLDADGQAER